MLKISKKRINRNIDIFILCSLGFIVLSPFTSYLSQNILKLPITAPEILFLPFFPRVKRILNLKLNPKILVYGIALITFLISLALIANMFPVSSILSTARGYFLMLLAFATFKDKSLNSIYDIFYIAIGSTFGWAFLSIISFKAMISSLFLRGSGAVYGNMIALGIIIGIPIIFHKKTKLVYSLLLILIISLTAGLRRQILISLDSYFFAFLSQLKLSFKESFRILIIASLLISGGVLLYPFTEDYIKSNSELLYKRIFTKTELLLSGEAGEADLNRINTLNEFKKDIFSYILPRGFVSKRTMSDKGTGGYMDSPYLEIFHTLGLFFGTLLALSFLYRIYINVIYYYKDQIRESALNLVMCTVTIVLLMIEGSFLNFVYTTPLTGYIFARIYSKRNLIT